ncbi:MAG: hypothetical protein ABEJ04_06170 [Halobacteriaceae archaeon]
MTATRLHDPIEVERDGVTVEKTVREEDHGVVHVELAVRSERSAPSRVRLVETVPEEVPPDEVGPHPDYEADWTLDDGGQLEYAATLQSGGEATTVYGIRNPDQEVIEGLDLAPLLEVSTASAAELDEEDSDAPDGDGLDPVGAPDDSAASADGGTATAPDAGTGTSSETAPDAGPGADADADGEAADPPDAPGGVASALAAELRAGNVPEEDVEELRAALDREREAEPSNSLEVRFRRVRRTVEDLAAYRDALEEFIDDNGTAAQTLEDLDGDLEELRSTVADLEKRLDRHADRLERLDALAEAVDRLEDDLDEEREWRAGLQSAISEDRA